MERSEPSSEVVDVFFRTTSLTPSRPDIVRQGRGREGVGDRSCTTSNTDMIVIALHSTFCQALHVEPQDAGPTPAVRVWRGGRRGSSRALGWLFLMRDNVPHPPMQASNATKGGKQDGGDPAAAPHGEMVHVHIGAGSLLCRPAGPPPIRYKRGKSNKC